jgi:signal transduction histidine kinase/HAMP domain-containing protein
VREPRSIAWYAWAGLAVQCVLVAGAVAFLLTGGNGAAAIGLALPTVVMAAALRWTSRPLREITGMVRRRTQGDYAARSEPHGPAEVRELATSLNSLADETDRQRAAQAERSRLLMEVQQVSGRIREHLHAGAVIREAVAAIGELLPVDRAWVGLTAADELRPGQAGRGAGRLDGIAGPLSPESAGWLQRIYLERRSYCVADLRPGPPAEMPAELRAVLLDPGASSLLLTAFGAGAELLGAIALLRNDPRQRWSQAETEAMELLAGDVGRALEHARLYEGKGHLVAELQALDQAKTSFIAAASHDVRTPLTSILGNLELIMDGEAGPVNPEQGRMLDAVQRNARRLQTLIEDMLTISKIELGAFTSDLQPMDLAGIVPAAAEITAPTAAEAGLSFSFDCPDRGLMIEGDPEQLDRVLSNLLSNAVKYTAPGGAVTLTAARAGASAVLTVTDTGMGIPERERKSLFTRFFRASNAVARAIPGSGLGLSIVRTIVLNHHGEVDLRSTEGVGTTVAVRIPLLDTHVTAAADAAGAPQPVPLPRGYQPGGRR